MKIRTLILFMAVLLILSSCAKRKAQKIIEGSWSEVIVDGVDVPEAAQDILIWFGFRNETSDSTQQDTASSLSLPKSASTCIVANIP